MTEPKWGQSIADMELEERLRENLKITEILDREFQRILEKPNFTVKEIEQYVWNTLPWYQKLFFPSELYQYWRKKK